MKFTAVLALVGAAAAAYDNVTYTTLTVSSVVTYCPGPTTLTHGTNTYTVTEATTLTITDCPCTVTKPVTSTPVVACTTCGYNATVPATKPPTGTGSVVPPTNPPVAAGAGKVVLSGAALVGVLGVAALL